MKEEFEELEQYDFIDDEYLGEVEHEYSQAIGMYLIQFSILEHTLNIAIAENMHHGSHEGGYVIIESLNIYSKIDLFYKIYLRLISITDSKNEYKELLDSIMGGLKETNAFRNTIVHANWSTITKDNYVRSKIVVDNEEGYVKFKKTKITTDIIEEKMKMAGSLIDDIEAFSEKALAF